MEELKQRLDNLKDKIVLAAQKSGRSLKDIGVVCVAKQARLDDLLKAIEYGCCQIGENRVQEAEKKYAFLKNVLPGDKFSSLRWHMVGHLQANKAARAIEIFDCLESVDSLRLLEVIEKQALKKDKIIDILIQVNISAESTKFGVSFDEAHQLIMETENLPHARLTGLMGIAAFAEDAEKARPAFKSLKKFFEEENKYLTAAGRPAMSVLSMGMSGDFAVAIEEGATMIRVGRTIFGG